MTDGGRARGVERAAAPEREPGRRLVDVELSKEDVRKELSLRILAHDLQKQWPMPTCEKRRSTVTVAELAGQPRY